MKKSKVVEYLKTLLQKLLGIAVIILAWEIMVRTSPIYHTIIPSPLQVFNNLTDMALAGTLWKHAIVSLQRICIGYILATMIAIPLGFLIGGSETFERYIDPPLQMLRQVPLFAWLPILILICGMGETSKIIMVTLAAIWWILLSTISAVRNVDPIVIKAAKSLGTCRWNIFWKVVLPSSVPSIFVGLRGAYTDVILALSTVEMLGGPEGLGTLLVHQECHQGPEHVMTYSINVFLIILGLTANYALAAAEKMICKWRE